MAAASTPAFPNDIPVHPLLVVDFKRIKAQDEREVEKLWQAGTKLGFWYLSNHQCDEEVNRMFELGAETMALPLEEKMKFEQGDSGLSFGYKAAGANAVDATGQLDTAEFLNIAKDDALAWPKQARRTYPPTTNARMASTIVPFIRKSLDINDTLLEVFNERLGLPPNKFLTLHSRDEFSGSEARIIRNAPTSDVTRQAIGSHTDFGSLSFLHNRLGGLQVLVPGAESWQYVKPIPGLAICNIGDALAILSGGILRSNLHRVLPPPGAQANLERWSLVYFTRPGNSVMLRALTADSKLVAEAVAAMPEKHFETDSTALDWFSRRIKYQRISNRKGPETWMASRGTEQGEV